MHCNSTPAASRLGVPALFWRRRADSGQDGSSSTAAGRTGTPFPPARRDTAPIAPPPSPLDPPILTQIRDRILVLPHCVLAPAAPFRHSAVPLDRFPSFPFCVAAHPRLGARQSRRSADVNASAGTRPVVRFRQ